MTDPCQELLSKAHFATVCNSECICCFVRLSKSRDFSTNFHASNVVEVFFFESLSKLVDRTLLNVLEKKAERARLTKKKWAKAKSREFSVTEHFFLASGRWQTNKKLLCKPLEPNVSF